MSDPKGTHYYFRGEVDGSLPAPRRPAASPFIAERTSRAQVLGLLLILAAIVIPVVATCAIVFALRLLA